MVQCFLNNEKLDIDFASIAIKYLDAVRGADWNDVQLKYLKLKNVEVLIFNLDEVRPKSKVREEKKMIIRYLETPLSEVCNFGLLQVILKRSKLHWHLLTKTKSTSILNMKIA